MLRNLEAEENREEETIANEDEENEDMETIRLYII